MITTPLQGEISTENAGITVSGVYNTTVEDLWDAITTPERLRRWFGDIRRWEDGTGFDAELTTEWDGAITIENCDAPRSLHLTFRDETADATTSVSATLVPTPEGTRLTVTESGFPASYDLTNYVAGWQAQLEQLHAMVSGGNIVEWRPRWEELRAAYRADAAS